MNCDLRLSDEAGTTLRRGARCHHSSRGREVRAPFAVGSGDLFGLAVGRSSQASTRTPRRRTDRDATTVVEQKDLI
jgi:hypothetical protein